MNLRNKMKKTLLFLSICLLLTSVSVDAQQNIVPAPVFNELASLIDSYSTARENQDTLLLKAILTQDIDQLVSSGEWRLGITTAVEGMKRSSQVNEGKRTLKVERARLLDPKTALIDAKYTLNPPMAARSEICGVPLLLFIKMTDGRLPVFAICFLLGSNRRK